MSVATKVILLEHIEKLGGLGDIVSVKPGYARNFLFPQHKALRANKANVAYFEARKKHIQADNDKKKAAAEKLAKGFETLTVSLIRQASEGGQLYGSVTSRDIAEQICAESNVKIERSMVSLNQNFKMIGLFPVEVALHPEVKVCVTVNIARTPDEAALQLKNGKALIAADFQDENASDETSFSKEEADEKLKEALEEKALESEKQRREEAQTKDAQNAEKAAVKAEIKAARKAAKAQEEAAPAPEIAEEEEPSA